MNANTLSQDEIDALLRDEIEEKSLEDNPQEDSFSSLAEEKKTGKVNNISFLNDIPMTLTVELGRTKKLIQEVLEIEKGSIVELDRLAGEAVDLFINGKLFAKGEVVVVDENFGIRVVEIVKSKESSHSLEN